MSSINRDEKEWKKAIKVISGLREGSWAVAEASLNESGRLFRDSVLKTIKRGTIKPVNAPLTVSIKGSSKPLVASGAYAMNVAYGVGKKNKRLIAKVGVKRGAVTKDKAGNSTKLDRIAGILEEGATIQVTKKMRAFLFFNYGVRLKKSTTMIRIPARPLWGNTLKRRTPLIYKKLQMDFQKFLEALAQ